MNEIQVNNQPKGIQEDERSLLIDYYVQKVEVVIVTTSDS